MYNTSSLLPAPYEMSAPAQPAQAFSHGGRAHGKLVPAHFNKAELDVLEHAQGGRHVSHGMRSLAHLEGVMKNPHIKNAVHHHTHRRKHASGGLTSNGLNSPGYSPTEVHGLAAGGRNGDTEMALIGPHTHNMLNQLAGHATENPTTGYPEYFSLSDMLGGIGDAFGLGSVGKAIGGLGDTLLPSIAPMAGSALGGMFGGPAGALMGGQLGSTLGNSISKTNLGSPQQAAGGMMQHAGQQMGGGAGDAMGRFGQAMSQGGGYGDALKQTARGAFDNAGGMNGLKSMGMNAFNGFKQGGMQGGLNSLRTGAQQMGGNFANSMRPQNMPRLNPQHPQDQLNPYQ